MERNVCPICGSPYSLDEKGRFVCRYCGYVKPETATPEETALLFEASAKLRLADFDGARERYEDITSRFPKCAEAYWGLTLCQYGIKYEDDYDGKKIATCYAASYESLYDNPDYKKAISLADPEARAYYESQAKVIELRRKEWVGKARKEAPYDVFLSYKDSDGGKRTSDSYKAHDLYNELTARGYRVFFSRVSLKDKTGENYEPYIFAALNSAPVMLVYASDPEYVKATWVKNEWNRYLARIKSGEKAADSLCVVVDGFNPSALPPVLKNKQHLLYGNLTFLQDLLSYVEKQVNAASLKTHRLERKEVALAKKKAKKGIEAVKAEEVSSVKKKNKQLSHASLEKREIGASSVPLLTPNQESKLGLAEAYFSCAEYDKAKSLYENVLQENPRHPVANFGLLLCGSKASDLADWGKKTDVEAKMAALPSALSVVDFGGGEDGKAILGLYADTCLSCLNSGDEENAKKVYESICAYEIPGFHEKVLLAIEGKGKASFADVVLPYISVDPDSYKKHLLLLAKCCLGQGDHKQAKAFMGQYADYFDFDAESYVLFLCAEHKRKDEASLFSGFAQKGDFSVLSGSLPLEQSQIEALFQRLANFALEELKQGRDSAPYASFLLPYRMPFREGFIQDAIAYCMEHPGNGTSSTLEALLPSFDEAHRDSFLSVIRSFSIRCLEAYWFELAAHWLNLAIEYFPEERELYGLRILARLESTEEILPIRIERLESFGDVEAILSLRGNDSFASLLQPYTDACLKASDPKGTLPVFDALIAYLPKEEEGQLHSLLCQMAELLLGKGLYQEASKYYGSAVAIEPKDHASYWGLLKCRLECKDDEGIIASPTPIAGLPEYENATLAASEDKKVVSRYINIELKQKTHIEKEQQRLLEERKRFEIEEQKRIARTRKRRRRFIISSSSVMVVALSTVVAFTVVVPSVNGMIEQQRQDKLLAITGAIESGSYQSAIQILSDFNDPEAKPLNSMALAGASFAGKDFERGIDFVVQAGGQVKVHYDGQGVDVPKSSEIIKKKWIDNHQNGYDTSWSLDHYAISVAKQPYSAEIWLSLASSNAVTYHLSYDLEGGYLEGENPSSYTVNDSFELISPKKEGFAFLGWFDGQTKITPTFTGKRTGDFNLTAKWQRESWGIRYNLNGGENNPSNPDRYPTNNDFFLLQRPSKEGCIFKGWFDPNGVYVASIPKEFNADIELTATWDDAADYKAIYSVEDFENISDNPSGKYYLANDLNFSSQSGFASLESFEGTLDGGFHVISKAPASLFKQNSGIIENLKLSNCSGPFAEENKGRIERCASEESNVSSPICGGIARTNAGVIKDSYFSGDLLSNWNYTISFAAAGGICGINRGAVENCYSSASIESKSTFGGSAMAGGICGSSGPNLSNCYFTGSVKSVVTTTATGSFSNAGFITGSQVTCDNCYYLLGSFKSTVNGNYSGENGYDGGGAYSLFTLPKRVFKDSYFSYCDQDKDGNPVFPSVVSE